MTFRLATPESPRRTSPLWLQILLWGGFLLSLFIGLLALLGLALLPDAEQETALVTADPLSLVEPAQIPPHLALLQLAGADGSALVRQAATAGERHLAYSILVYDGALSPTVRATEFLRIGLQFLAADDLVRAQAAFYQTRTTTLFAVSMPPLERGQLLARSADGLLQTGDIAGARQTAVQAQHVAVQSAGLLPAQRAQILQAAEPLLRTHGSPQEARQVAELLRSPAQSPTRIALISQMERLRDRYPAPPLLAELRQQRIAAAQALIERMRVAGSQDIEPERDALAQALLAEDRVWNEFYANWNNPALQLAQRHGLLLDYRDWLLIKVRAAEGGFGLRLVEGWAVEVDALRGALGRVMGELGALLNVQIDEETDPAVRAMLRLESLQWLALQAELGFYPNGPVGELSSRMERIQAELESLGVPPDLPIFYDLGAAPPGFRIARRYE